MPGTGHRDPEDLPRPDEEPRQPSAAERVRTLLASNASATLTIPGADQDDPAAWQLDHRVVAPSGDVYLLAAPGSPAARIAAHALDDELTAVIELTDVAPVAVPQRIRGRGWVAGWLTTASDQERHTALRLLTDRYPALDALPGTRPAASPAATGRVLRLEVGEAFTDDLWGACHVEPEEFAEAAPDPLARHEADLLQHLAAAHGAQLRTLCTLLGDGPATCGPPYGQGGTPWETVVPLGLDRFGLRVRFRAGAACFDARFEFPEPVRDLTQLRRAMRQLFEAAGT
ncbi:DUF2470 domain-containing protein [Streptomyces marincola]|uniref:DUF2470 domain-containing protein n=1 Tax=Streptomyces marincola TaxID=2878388 RepID=UPI001CF3394C|nr:DUF2470 domain-containing protein [Streptomyces marincola]UCM86812.1 DUF2470 domain-containing protein [Streptomyces marincola]